MKEYIRPNEAFMMLDKNKIREWGEKLEQKSPLAQVKAGFNRMIWEGRIFYVVSSSGILLQRDSVLKAYPDLLHVHSSFTDDVSPARGDHGGNVVGGDPPPHVIALASVGRDGFFRPLNLTGVRHELHVDIGSGVARVLVENPGATAVKVDLELLTSEGKATPEALKGVLIPAFSRRSFRLNDYCETFDVSTVVSASGPGRVWAHSSTGSTAE